MSHTPDELRATAILGIQLAYEDCQLYARKLDRLGAQIKTIDPTDERTWEEAWYALRDHRTTVADYEKAYAVYLEKRGALVNGLQIAGWSTSDIHALIQTAKDRAR